MDTTGFAVLLALKIASGLAVPSFPAVRARGIESDTLVTRDSLASIRGIVTDSARVPVPLATVLLDGGGIATYARPDGTFGPLRIDPGRHRLTVAADGFDPVGASFSIAPAASLHFEVRLVTNGVRLPAIRVDARRLFGEPRFSGFARRRATGTGRYIDQQEIAARGYPPLTELVRTVPGVRLIRVPNQLGGGGYLLEMRGRLTLGTCPTQIYVDGEPTALAPGDPMALDHLVASRELAAVEVYTGSSSVPPQFSGPNAGCGVLVLWTRDRASSR